MSHFEYLLPLVSIVIGLALADLLTSLHKLIRRRKQIRWHWIPMAWTSLILLTILEVWWRFYFIGPDELLGSYLGFLVFFVELVFFFLFVSAVLPDKIIEGLDLEQFYFDNKTYFFTVGALYILTDLIRQFVVVVYFQEVMSISAFMADPLIFIPLLGTTSLASLAIVDNHQYHRIITVGLLLLFIAFLFLSIRSLS